MSDFEQEMKKFRRRRATLRCDECGTVRDIKSTDGPVILWTCPCTGRLSAGREKS